MWGLESGDRTEDHNSSQFSLPVRLSWDVHDSFDAHTNSHQSSLFVQMRKLTKSRGFGHLSKEQWLSYDLKPGLWTPRPSPSSSLKVSTEASLSPRHQPRMLSWASWG